MRNLDEILENLTKAQNPTRVLHDLATPEPPAATNAQKNSDMLYLTIGIIAGILLILIIILIVMCLLRIFQRKKFIGTISFSPVRTIENVLLLSFQLTSNP